MTLLSGVLYFLTLSIWLHQRTVLWVMSESGYMRRLVPSDFVRWTAAESDNKTNKQLFMTLRWRSQCLLVEYMIWEDFRDAVDGINHKNVTIPHPLISYNLIWGGADFNLDLVYVFEYHWSTNADSIKTQRRPQYGFKTSKKVKDHADRLQALSRLTPVWPPVDEILAASRKADVIKVFDRIANEVTHTVRPTTTLLTLPLKSLPRDVVLKREGSDTAEHVLLPQQLQDTTLKSLNNYLKGRFRWFAQTWIPELRQFGEWRVFIVDGKIIEIVITQPQDEKNGLMVGVLRGSWSLEELTSAEFTSLLLIAS